ncbi:MAG: PEGA domain-containing protein, partial [Acidimicrobiia bacterium]
GRPLAAEEFPAQLQDLVGAAQEYRGGEARPLSASFSNWLTRALQFDVRTAFQAPSDAQLAFEAVLASDRSYVTSSARLEEWLSALGAAIDEKKAPKPDPEVLRRQEEERARELERQREEERQRELERQREIEREQERQTAREVERLREQDRERELELERERERARALELASVATPVALDAAAPRVEAAPPAPVAPPVEPVSVAPAPVAGAPSRSPMVYLMAGAVVLLVAFVGWLLVTRDSGGLREGEGELAVQSRPQGARVVVDGKEQGVTPLTVRLNAGAHVLEVQVGKSEPRVIPLNIQAGVQTSQYIELQGVTGTGTLEVRSEPSGARVTVDGQPRGTTPATLRDHPAGDHTVVVEAGGRKATQTVRIVAGSTAQLVVPLPRR